MKTYTIQQFKEELDCEISYASRHMIKLAEEIRVIQAKIEAVGECKERMENLYDRLKTITEPLPPSPASPGD